jgi:hypothetical protein
MTTPSRGPDLTPASAVPPGGVSSACAGCGAILPEADGPTHRYLESSAACWSTYGEVLAREYGDPGLFRRVHRLTVDVYAVQHPGRPSAQAIQSVAVHLMSLCALLEGGSGAEGASKLIREGVRVKRRFVWLQPPQSMGPLTVADVGKARGPAEHERAVRDWASSAWHAWAPHHATVRQWCSDVRRA